MTWCNRNSGKAWARSPAGVIDRLTNEVERLTREKKDMSKEPSLDSKPVNASDMEHDDDDAVIEQTVWEYRIIIDPRLTTLNAAGKEGWELVSVTTTLSNDQMAYLKRRK